MRKGPPAMNNRKIAEHIIGLSLDMSMHDVESIERIEKALDIKDDHATEVQTKLLTQITTLRVALQKCQEISCTYHDKVLSALGEQYEEGDEFRGLIQINQISTKALVAVPTVLATSQGDTEVCGSDLDNAQASAERKNPECRTWQADRSYMAICLRALIGLCRMWEPDHSSQDDVRWIGFAESHLAKLETQYSSDKPLSPESSLSDNERVMDLIRAAEKYFCQTEKDCHCLDMNYEVCDVCKEQLLAISVATNALPPHIIERARKGE